MEWYYAENNQQRGPVDDAQFNLFVQQGIIRPDTLVWNATMSDWLPLSQVRPTAPAVPFGGTQPASNPFGTPDFGAAGGDARASCSQCGSSYPLRDMIQYGTLHICADCKPAFFQRMRENGGTTFAGPMNYAGFWIRTGAIMIDWTIQSGVAIAILMAYVLTIGQGVLDALVQFSQTENLDLLLPYAGGIAVILLILVTFSIFYQVYFVGKRGATPGKIMLKLKIVRSDGSPVSYMRAFGRMLAHGLNGIIGSIITIICNLIPIVGTVVGYVAQYVPYYMAGWDAEKRALHDHVCDTRVIRE